MEDLALALELADVADSLSMRVFDSAAFETVTKTDGSPVSAADTAIESEMRRILSARRPADVVYGEEFGGAREGHRVWMLDPIDGTASFVVGGNDWATLIGLVEDGEPVVGVVSRPTAGVRWWGAKGSGAFRNGSPIRVSTTARLADAVMHEDFRVSVHRGLDDNPVAALARGCAAVEPFADVFFFFSLCEGAVDFAVNWWAGSGPDLAGPVAILAAAGGRFSDLDGRVDIDADVHVISNGVLHAAVLARLHELIDERGYDPTLQPEDPWSTIKPFRLTQPVERWSARVNNV